MTGKSIKYLILDADGVLTDARVFYTDDGREMKAFDIKDGHGIKLLMRAGIGVAILTGRYSPALLHRAKDLGIEHVVEGAKDKRTALIELAKTLQAEPGEMAYMGDDVVDLPAMSLCAMSFAPSDAVKAVRERVDVVTSLPGGRGAVREAIEILLERMGLLEEVMKRYVG